MRRCGGLLCYASHLSTPVIDLMLLLNFFMFSMALGYALHTHLLYFLKYNVSISFACLRAKEMQVAS